MRRFNHIFIYSVSTLLSVSLLLSSCSQDENILDVDSDEVSFIASVPGVTSRAPYELTKEFFNHGFTVSAFCPDNDPEDDGLFPTHCEGQIVEREVDGIFRSNGCRWPNNEGDNSGRLKFFAFHPIISVMKDRGGFGNEYFGFSNSSTKNSSGINYDYRLTRFRVIQDIAKQVDFVTAIGEGNKTADIYSRVELNFEHQLSGVEIGAWGGATLYDIEIAGVRIGGIAVEADFELSTERENVSNGENTIGSWVIPAKPVRGYVDYVFSTGDKVVGINTNEHNTKESAVSIMGGGGNALVIPQKQGTWDYKNDKTNDKGGMYFSALIRLTERGGDGHRIYPSTDPDSQDYIVYLSVRKSDGTVMRRLDKYGNEFGTTNHYDIPDTEELRHYGWAAVPANIEWKAGFLYSYVLDYSNGVGIHDPADPNPASTIVDWGGVEVTTTTGEWGDGEFFKTQGWGANTNNTGPDGTVWWK